MIVIDTSAVVSIYHVEEDAEVLAACLAASELTLVSAASVLEASIVMGSDRLGDASSSDRWIDEFLRREEIQIRDVTADQLLLARIAFRQFGKGRHPARLNFGDCFSYALAKSLDVPLLYKGGDFSRTDITPAL